MVMCRGWRWGGGGGYMNFHGPYDRGLIGILGFVAMWAFLLDSVLVWPILCGLNLSCHHLSCRRRLSSVFHSCCLACCSLVSRL